MVKRGKKHNRKRAAKQAIQATHPEPNKIGASTPYDFEGRNLTPYGGLLPVATMLEKLGLQQLLEATITSKRVTRVMSLYKCALGIVLGFYVGFQRLNQLRFIARDPILTGVLGVDALPPQSTLWRFLAGLHLNVAGQVLKIQQAFRQRVWQAANVKLETATLDTDTTVHTVYGKQMGARKSYNPKNKSKLSYQPILTFMAENPEYIYSDLHNRDLHSGKEIAAHIQKGDRLLARNGENDIRTCRFGFLLRGGGRGLRGGTLPIHRLCAQNGSARGGIAKGRMEAVKANRCR